MSHTTVGALAFICGFAVCGCQPEAEIRGTDSTERLPVRPEQVRLYRDTQQIPNVYTPVAVITPSARDTGASDSLLVERARGEAAKLGANGIVVTRRGGVRSLLTVRVGNERRPCPGTWVTIAGKEECARIGVPVDAVPVPASELSGDPAARARGSQ